MNRSFRSALTLAVATAALIVGACTVDGTDGPGNTVKVPTLKDTALSVNTLEPAANAPRIVNPVVSFWAIKGERSEAFMYYAKPGNRPDSTVFVRFRVERNSLVNRPNGTPIADGDSILITMTLVDSVKLEVGFEPSGLVFNPADPAILKMNYRETDPDYDDDGDVDSTDTAIPTIFAIWRRETPTSPWIRQTSTVARELNEVETAVGGFTGYVIAW